LVKEFRKLDQVSKILLITQDEGAFYSKPQLSTGFAKGKAADDLIIGDAENMAKKLDIEIRNFTTVVGINPETNQVLLENEKLSYKKLVLATGAVVNRLDIPGFDHEKVMSINDLKDYRHFRNRVSTKQHVLIIGAGLIGCEFANDLITEGKTVTLVHPFEAPLSGLIPEQAGKFLKLGLEAKGVKFYTRRSVTSIQEQGGHLNVSLDDESHIQADFVISSVGLKPNISLAKASGIGCNKGIKTDDYLTTNHDNIYALGDCAEVEGQVLLYVLPLMACARALAKTLSGNPTKVSYPAMPIMTKTPACPVVVLLPADGNNSSWQIEDDTSSYKSTLSDEFGKLRGFVLTGVKVAEKQALMKLLPASLK
jgi:rubredoxin-NAD+ reductase